MKNIIRIADLFLTPLSLPQGEEGKGKRRYNPSQKDAIPVSAENKLFFDVETEGLFQSKTILGLAYNNNGDYWVLGCDEPNNIKDYQEMFNAELTAGKKQVKVYLVTISDFFDYVYQFDGILVGGNPLFDLSRGADRWDLKTEEPTLYRDNYRVKSKPMGYGRKVIKEKIGKKGKRIKNSTKAVLDVLQIAGAVLGSPKLSLDKAGKDLNTKYQKQKIRYEDIKCDLRTLKYLLFDVLTTKEVYYKVAKMIPEDDFGGLYSGASIGKACYRRMGLKQVKMELKDKIPCYESYYGGRSEVNLVGIKTSKMLSNLDFFSFYPNIQIQLGLMRFNVAEKIIVKQRLDLIQEIKKIRLTDLKDPEVWRKYSGILLEISIDCSRLPIRTADNDKNINISLPYLTTAPKITLYYSIFDYLYAKLWNTEISNNRGRIKIIDVLEYVAVGKEKGLTSTNVFGCNTKPETFFHDLLNYRLSLKKALKKTNDPKEIERLKAAIFGVKIVLNSTSYGITIERQEKITEHYNEYETSRGKAKTRYSLIEGQYTVPIVGTQITAAARLLSGICEILEKKKTGHTFYEVDTDGFVVENDEEIRAFWDRWRLFPNKDFLEYDDEPHTYFYGISPKRYLKICKDGRFWSDGTKEHSLGSYVLGKGRPDKLRKHLVKLGMVIKLKTRELTDKERKWLSKPVLVKINLHKSTELISLNNKGVFPRPYSFAWRLIFDDGKDDLLCVYNDINIDRHPKPDLIVRNEIKLTYNAVSDEINERVKTRTDVAKHYFQSNPHKYELPNNAKGWMKIPHFLIKAKQYITKTGSKGVLNENRNEMVLAEEDKALEKRIRKIRKRKENKLLVNAVKEKLGITVNEMVKQKLIPNKHYELTTKHKKKLEEMLGGIAE